MSPKTNTHTHTYTATHPQPCLIRAARWLLCKYNYYVDYREGYVTQMHQRCDQNERIKRRGQANRKGMTVNKRKHPDKVFSWTLSMRDWGCASYFKVSFPKCLFKGWTVWQRAVLSWGTLTCVIHFLMLERFFLEDLQITLWDKNQTEFSLVKKGTVL